LYNIGDSDISNLVGLNKAKLTNIVRNFQFFSSTTNLSCWAKTLYKQMQLLLASTCRHLPVSTFSVDCEILPWWMCSMLCTRRTRNSESWIANSHILCL